MKSGLFAFTLPPSDEAERKTRIPNYRRRKLVLGGIVVAIFIGFVVLTAWDYSVCPITQIVPAGTSLTIQGGKYTAYSFNVTRVLNTNRPIYGSLKSNGTAEVYVATADQFKYWTATGAPAAYEYYSGPVTSLNYSVCNKYCPPNSPAAPLGLDYFIIRSPGQSSIAVNIGSGWYVDHC